MPGAPDALEARCTRRVGSPVHQAPQGCWRAGATDTGFSQEEPGGRLETPPPLAPTRSKIFEVFGFPRASGLSVHERLAAHVVRRVATRPLRPRGGWTRRPPLVFYRS